MAGRGPELERLGRLLASAAGGEGAALLLSGEPGIGKTRLVDEFARVAASRGATVMRGAARKESSRPYHLLAEALGPAAAAIFDPVASSSFSAAFLLDADGRQLAAASGSRGGGARMDASLLAGTLQAVQEFVKDTFGAQGGLGQLDIGGTSVLLSRSHGLALVAVVDGQAHPDMRAAVDSALAEIAACRAGAGQVHGAASSPSAADRAGEGRADVAPSVDPARADEALARLAARRFSVRRSMEGARLESERARVASMALDRLAEPCSAGPVLLVAEDLHWADGPTLHALAFIARNARPLRLMLLATMRRGESPEADAAADAMVAEGACEPLSIGPLDSGAVAELVASGYSPNDFPEGFAEGLARDCAGNPLFAVELLRHMRETGALAAEDGVWTLRSSAASAPASLSELVERRLAALPPDAMAMAEWCACIGRSFRRDAALSREGSPDPGAELSALASAGIVSPGEPASFTHALFQEVTYRNVSPRWRTAHHRSVGEAFERLPHDGQTVFELARHFHLGAVPAKALPCCVRAGEAAEASFAAEQGIGLYSWALEDAARCLAGSELAATASDLRERLGDLRFLKGQYDASDADYSLATEGADGPRRAHLLRKRALVLERQSRYDDALALATRARAEAPDGFDGGKSLATEAFVLVRKGDFARASAAAREAMALLAGASDRDALVKLARCHNVIGVDHRRRAQYAEAIAHNLEALAISERAGDENSVSTAYSHLGNVYWLMGDIDRALEYHTKDLAVATKRGDPYDMALVLANLGNVHLKRKDYGAAADNYSRAMAIRERIGDRQGIAVMLNNLGVVRFETGDAEGAASCYSRAAQISEAIGDKQNVGNALYNLGEAEMSLGRHGHAREILAGIRAKALEWGLATRAATVLVMMAENELRAGDAARARELAAEAEREASGQGFGAIAAEAKAVLARAGQA